MHDNDDLFDHDDDLLAGEAPLTREEGRLYPLFAEALDPTNDKTVAQAVKEWKAIFNASS